MDRDSLLQRALLVVAREGGSELTIERLVAALGVTKGSFYWHFRDRSDFVRALAGHWAFWSTKVVAAEFEDLPPELFRALGFEGFELNNRARIFVTFVSFEQGLFVRESKSRRLAELDRRLRILIGR